MSSFSTWLETKNRQIVFGTWRKDGVIVVYIDGKRYVYLTDAAYHDYWRRTAKYQPGKVLNQILQQVKNGNAQQLNN